MSRAVVSFDSGSGGEIVLHLSAEETQQLMRLVIADNVANKQRTNLEYVLVGAMNEYAKRGPGAAACTTQ